MIALWATQHCIISVRAASPEMLGVEQVSSFELSWALLEQELRRLPVGVGVADVRMVPDAITDERRNPSMCSMLTCWWLVWTLQKSKKCPIVIKAGLSPVSGNATWSPKEGVATATYFVRAFVMHNSSATVQYQVALGNSQGYFQVRIRGFKPSFNW